MLSTAIPRKFAKTFAANAGAGFIRQIPDASQVGVQTGAASFSDGFPPACFSPIAAGGSWPFGQDFNGLLNQDTAWAQWQQAGGPIVFDATFAAAIGGYPKGAQLLSATTVGLIWVNTVEANSTNPDTGGAGWTTIYNQVHGWNAIQTFNASIILANNVPLLSRDTSSNQRTLLYYGADNQVHMQGGTAGFAVANAAGSANNVSWDDLGNVLVRGLLNANGILIPNNVALASRDAGGVTRNLLFYGTDNIVRISGGAGGFVVSNVAATQNNILISDAGALSVRASVTAGGTLNSTGDIIANGGHLRAGINATGSGDFTVATLLGDFPFTNAASNVTWSRLPSGLIDQSFIFSAPTTVGILSTGVAVPVAFPNAMIDCSVCFALNLPPSVGSIAVQIQDRASVIVTTNSNAVASFGCFIRCRGW